VDQLLLACFHYDPSTARYSLAVMRMVRVAGLATLLVIGGAVVLLRRREPKGSLPQDSAR
jgi:protein SCO1/2